MNNYKLPYFEDIDIDETEEYYEIDIEFDGENIQLDINSEQGSTLKSVMDKVKMFLDNLSEFKAKANKAIIDDFKKGESVKDYIDHHLEVIDEDELEILLKNGDKKLSSEEQLLSLLQLARIGFYLENEDEFAVFDYTIGRDTTQYLVVLNFNSKGGIEYITMES